MKTSELIGAQLDWAVAKCEGMVCTTWRGVVLDQFNNPVMYSDDWGIAGPIIERNLITIFRHDEEWFAHSQLSTPEDFHGDTPLIAAMRCYVASILGDEVEIPEELT
jgi:hypothetical protein